ncbi:[weak similarity to] ATP-dependent protease ATP-binding subunit, partial [methanotrophic bacterial endosymbiont of Bathymodiolus sp.]
RCPPLTYYFTMRLLEAVSFDAPDLVDKDIVIDAEYVNQYLSEFVQDEDLSRYIL